MQARLGDPALSGGQQDALSCSFQGTSSQLAVTASRPPAAEGADSEPISIASTGSLQALTLSACPARLHPLLAVLQRLQLAKTGSVQVRAVRVHMLMRCAPHLCLT